MSRSPITGMVIRSGLLAGLLAGCAPAAPPAPVAEETVVVYRPPPFEPVLVRTEGLPPRFEDYPAQPLQARPAPVDLSSHPEAPRRAALLREAAARGPNFAGHYTLVSWREPGQLGESFLIVDARTGRVHDGRVDVPRMEYRLTSRLIRFAAPEPLPGRVRCAGCTESYEVWDGRTLTLIPPELWAPTAPPPAEWRELVERVRAEEEPAVLATLVPTVLRPTWDRLVITAESGERRVFQEEVVQGDLQSIHRFAGAHDPIGAFVVVRQYVPEGRAVLLVDRATGRVTEIDDLPAPAPDGGRFATASLDLVAGHHPNRIRIYRVELAGPVLEWELEPRGWGARNPVWIDEHTLRLERGVVDWNTHQIRSSPMVLRHSARGWLMEPSSDHARDALLSFLSALGQGFYPEASLLYGGSYEQLRTWNPNLDPSDLPSLWRAACEGNGLQCLGRAELVRTERVSPDETRVTVRLYRPSGELFVLGPCCAETEATMPTRREFTFTVRREGDRYLVTSLPPYMP